MHVHTPHIPTYKRNLFQFSLPGWSRASAVCRTNTVATTKTFNGVDMAVPWRTATSYILHTSAAAVDASARARHNIAEWIEWQCEIELYSIYGFMHRWPSQRSDELLLLWFYHRKTCDRNSITQLEKYSGCKNARHFQFHRRCTKTKWNILYIAFGRAIDVFICCQQQHWYA